MGHVAGLRYLVSQVPRIASDAQPNRSAFIAAAAKVACEGLALPLVAWRQVVGWYITRFAHASTIGLRRLRASVRGAKTGVSRVSGSIWWLHDAPRRLMVSGAEGAETARLRHFRR
jgi:hypothetical protein